MLAFWLTCEAGKSRAEAAAALNLSVSAVAMYKNGDRIPRDETKLKIAEYYGKSVEEIFIPKNVTKGDKMKGEKKGGA